MTDLDDRIIGAVVDRHHPRPDAVPTIRYTERSEEDDTITFFELSPLITALRTLLTTGRPLTPTDLVPPAGPATVDRSLDDAISVPRQRPEAVRDALDDLADDVADHIRDLDRLYPPAPAPPRRRDIVDDIDSLLTRHAELVTRAGGFGMVRSGWGELTAWRRGVFTGVLADVAATADRMARSARRGPCPARPRTTRLPNDHAERRPLPPAAGHRTAAHHLPGSRPAGPAARLPRRHRRPP